MSSYSKYCGKSMPMNEKFSDFSMIGVVEKPDVGLKFCKVDSQYVDGKYAVLLFMDNKASELELKEWLSFNERFEEFEHMNVKLIGVSTDSHVAVRSFMQEHHLRGIKFPIIADRDGTMSKSFGVLKTSNNEFCAARALAILNEKRETVFLAINNEKTASDPDNIMDLIKKLQDAEKKPSLS